jgi:regulatory protein
MKKTDSSRQAGDDSEYKNALLRAAGLCSRQEQCTSHIRDKLREWNVDDEIADKVIRSLKSEHYLDDQRFAGFYVKDKFKFNKWGKTKISFMLRQKKINQELIDLALAQLDEGNYFDTCRELIRSKAISLKETNQFTRKGKLFRYAAGKGFETDLIYKALNEVEKV